MQDRAVPRRAGLLDRLIAGLSWLVLPVSLLLCLQWPLRDYVQAFSREANDLGQILFALYAAASVAAATRAGAHLTAGNIATAYSKRTRLAIIIAGNVGAVVPWIGFIVWSGRTTVANSVAALERFQDSGNAGFFLIKLSVFILAGMLLAASVVECFMAYMAYRAASRPGEGDE
jgi:TRAP-type mannitol/chloroaromatic compound transport system permease small subunit